MRTPMVYWDAESGISKVVITAPDGSVHVGTAKCRDEDRDMLSEMTGCTIAEMRANIAYLKHERDFHIKPELKALKKFLFTINQSKYFEPGNYSNQMLFRAIRNSEEELTAINEEINNCKKELKEYMDGKAEMFKRYRNKQKAKN